MVKIEGRSSLRRKFNSMPHAVRSEVQKAVPSSGADLVGMMKRLAPNKTGALVSSIRQENPGDGYRTLVIAGGTPATRREVREGSGVFTDEAVLVEFGTKEHKAEGKFKGATIPAIPARPFFFNSWRAMKRSIKGKLSRSITRGIKKVAQGQ